MTLVSRKISGKSYYYSSLSYYLTDKSRSFSKYIGSKKPTKTKLAGIENQFRKEILEKLANKHYTTGIISQDEVIRTVLFRDLFDKKYKKLTALKKRKYDIDSTVLFTLTTLTTEEVDVSLDDIRNAMEKDSYFTQREQISKNMLSAVESIRGQHKLDMKYLLDLHKMTMASFETKTPGQIRGKQVYIHKIAEDNPLGVELSYRPPNPEKIYALLEGFVEWYNSTALNPIEKATMAHYKLYRIHPFLDGNKRICRLIFNKALLDDGFPLLNISQEKEEYFEALIESVETDKAKVLVDFTLKQYYKQVKEFVTKV
jgi:Fic family protein